jgi:hypothetical protein
MAVKRLVVGANGEKATSACLRKIGYSGGALCFSKKPHYQL